MLLVLGKVQPRGIHQPTPPWDTGTLLPAPDRLHLGASPAVITCGRNQKGGVHTSLQGGTDKLIEVAPKGTSSWHGENLISLPFAACAAQIHIFHLAGECHNHQATDNSGLRKGGCKSSHRSCSSQGLLKHPSAEEESVQKSTTHT